MAARVLWRRASDGFGDERATPEQVRGALAFGLPRAPSALLAQALFWADLTRLDDEALPPKGEVGQGGVVNGLYSIHMRLLDEVYAFYKQTKKA